MSTSATDLANAIIDRARHMIVSPVSEWDRVERDTATIAGLYKNYAVILAAIPALATFIGGLFRGGPFGAILVGSAGGYLLTLGATAALAFIADFLAPQFKGTSNQINAFKLVVYSATPGWVAGVFTLLGALGSLVTLAGGLYSLYVFYLGAPKLLKIPQDKAGIFTVIIAVTGALAMMIIGKVLPLG